MLVVDSLDTDYPLDGMEWHAFVDGLLSDGAVDAYCPECSHASTFKVDAPYLTSEQRGERAKLATVVVRAQCARYPNTSEYRMQCRGYLTVCFLHSGDSVKKIGMHPSKATLDFGIMDPLFTRRLSKQHRMEIGRAVGLRAHAVGVGAFVYLRRVFAPSGDGGFKGRVLDGGQDLVTIVRSDSEPGGRKGQDGIVTIARQDPRERRCGPNIEREFMDGIHAFCAAVKAIEAQLSRVFSNPGIGQRGEAREFGAMGRAERATIERIYELIRPGGTLDYKPAARRAPTGGGADGGDTPTLRCPVDCPASVTMCNLCLTHDTPGNFALGFACEYAGRGWMAPIISAGNSSGSAGSGSAGDDDQDTVAAGQDAGSAARQSERDNARDRNTKDKDAKNRSDREKAICEALTKLSKAAPKHFLDCPVCPPA